MSEAMLCAHCGEVIGVYEPLIALVDGLPLETSLLAEPGSARSADDRFHRACFVEVHEGEAEAEA
jgi:hypothetical protein